MCLCSTRTLWEGDLHLSSLLACYTDQTNEMWRLQFASCVSSCENKPCSHAVPLHEGVLLSSNKYHSTSCLIHPYKLWAAARRGSSSSRNCHIDRSSSLGRTSSQYIVNQNSLTSDTSGETGIEVQEMLHRTPLRSFNRSFEVAESLFMVSINFPNTACEI